MMTIMINGELIEVDSEEYKEWLIAQKTGKGYDD